MEKEISLDSILEMLEINKRELMLSKKFKSYKSLQEKLKEIEKERTEVLKGNKEVIEKILKQYDLGVLKHNEQ